MLDGGVVAENDQPHHLLQNNNGLFTQMVDQTGKQSSTYLKQVARSATTSRQTARRRMAVAHHDTAEITDMAGLRSESTVGVVPQLSPTMVSRDIVV